MSSMITTLVAIFVTAILNIVVAMVNDDDSSTGAPSLGSPFEDNRSLPVGSTTVLAVTGATVTWAVCLSRVLALMALSPGCRGSNSACLENESDFFCQIPEAGVTWLDWLTDEVTGIDVAIWMSQEVAARLLAGLQKAGRLVRG